MSKQEIAERQETFRKKYFSPEQLKALIAEQLSQQLVTLLPVPLHILSQRLLSEIMEKTQPVFRKMGKMSEVYQRRLSELSELAQAKYSQEEELGRADVKLNKKLYTLLDEFDQAMHSLPDFSKELDLKLQTHLGSIANQIAKESGFKLSIGGKVIGYKNQSSELIKQAQEAKQNIEELKEKNRRLQEEMELKEKERMTAFSQVKVVWAQNKGLQDRIIDLEGQVRRLAKMEQSGIDLSLKENKEENPLNKREKVQRQKKENRLRKEQPGREGKRLVPSGDAFPGIRDLQREYEAL